MTAITAIYEAAMLPEYWPSALQGIAETLGVAGCTLVTIDDAPRWVASTGFVDGMRLYMESDWHSRNTPLETLLKVRPYGFVREIDLFSRDEIDNIPIVRDLKRPAGFGWSAAMATPMPAGEMLLFSIEQFWEKGPLSDASMTQLEELRPHISRASLLAAKLQHQRAEAAVESLDLIGVAAAMVTCKGKVLAANDQFQSYRKTMIISAQNRLRLAWPQAGELLTSALERLSTDHADTATMSIAVPGQNEQPPFVLHVIPVRGRARDLFGAMTALIIVTAITGRAGPSATLLRAIFDLTPTESRIAEAIVSGARKEELLMSLGISSETERTHMKSIFSKTGFRSRSDMIRMLAGLGIPEY